MNCFPLNYLMSDPPRFCFLECIFMWKTLQQNLLSTLYSKTFFNCYILFPILFKFNENFSVFNLAGLEHSNLTTFLYKILYYYKTSVSLKNPIIYKKLYNTIKKPNHNYGLCFLFATDKSGYTSWICIQYSSYILFGKCGQVY